MNPHRASLSRHPLAQLAVAFAAGICAANYFPVALFVWWSVGGVCTAVVVIAVVRRGLVFAGASLLLAMACAGAVVERQGERRDELREFLGRQVILTGVLD